MTPTRAESYPSRGARRPFDDLGRRADPSTEDTVGPPLVDQDHREHDTGDEYWLNRLGM